MPNLLDAESSYMQGSADVQEWMAEFMSEWLAPIKEMQLLLWWQRQDPMMHASMKTIDPEAYAQVEKKVNELQERRKRNGPI